MKLITKKKNWLIFLLLFFIVFSPQVSLFSFNIKTVYLFVVIPSIFGFIKYFKSKNPPKYIRFLILLMLFSLFYNLMVYLLFGFIDISWVIKILMGFIELFAAIFMANVYVNLYKDEAFNKITIDLFLVGVIHSLLMLIIFISPNFRDTFYRFIQLSELAYNSTFRLDSQTRFSGMLNSGFGSLSVLNAILFLMGLYSYMFNSRLSLIQFVVGTLLLLISSILSGRLGIVVTLLIIVLSYLLPTFRKSVINKKLNFLLITIPLIFIFISLLNEYFPEKAQFAFETYFRYQNSGNLDNSTELVLSESLSPNLSIFNLFFGTGNYNIDYADSGYIVMLTGAGVIGVIISYSFLFASFNLLSFKSKSNKNYNYIILNLILIIIFINFKNLYFFGYNDVFQIYFLITCTAAVVKQKNILI
jgi:hypothetical protein